MENHAALMEELNRYYAVWQETNYVYTEWAKAHGISVSCLLALTAIDEGGEDCTQKKISQRWLIPKQTVNMILKDFERQKFVELLPMQGDKRNKRIQFTAAGRAYADTILPELRKAELSVIQKMGLERMHRFSEDGALCIKLFQEAGGRNPNDADA